MNIMLVWLMGIFTAFADDKPWSQGTAHVLPRGRWEMGVFAPLRVGAKDGMEIQLHPGWALVSPHVAVKLDLVELGGWNLAFRQSLTYPTPLLRGLARPGTGGVIAPDSAIPHIISSDSQFFLTKDLNQKHSLTLRLRTQLAGCFGEEQWLAIDAPIVYARTSVYRNHFAMNMALRFDGSIYKSLGYSWDSQAWWLPGSDANWALEDKLQLTWRPSSRLAIQGGAFLVYGEYTYGSNWHLLPMVDVQFAWGAK